MSDGGPSFSPGEILRDELDARGWSYIEFAEILGRPVQAVSEILNDHKEITTETAFEIGSALGTGPELWLNLQTNYRLRYAAMNPRRLSDVERRARLRALVPLRELMMRGWLPDTKDLDGLEVATCRFLQMPTIEDRPAIKAAARRTGQVGDFSPAQAAWIARVAEVGSRQSVARFDRDALGVLAGTIPSRLRDPYEVSNVRSWLQTCGVAFVCEMPLKSSKLDGAVVWPQSSPPVIALSTRGNRFDSFVFTLLHEIAHLWHRHVTEGEATIDEEHGSSLTNIAQEQEANTTAGEWIFPDGLHTDETITTSTVLRLADAHSVHSSLVIGRLQRDEKLAWSQFRTYIPKVRDLLPDLSGRTEA